MLTVQAVCLPNIIQGSHLTKQPMYISSRKLIRSASPFPGYYNEQVGNSSWILYFQSLRSLLVFKTWRIKNVSSQCHLHNMFIILCDILPKKKKNCLIFVHTTPPSYNCLAVALTPLCHSSHVSHVTDPTSSLVWFSARNYITEFIWVRNSSSTVSLITCKSVTKTASLQVSKNNSFQ